MDLCPLAEHDRIPGVAEDRGCDHKVAAIELQFQDQIDLTAGDNRCGTTQGNQNPDSLDPSHFFAKDYERKDDDHDRHQGLNQKGINRLGVLQTAVGEGVKSSDSESRQQRDIESARRLLRRRRR